VGKHPLDEENVIIMEYAHFMPYISQYLHPKLPEVVSQEFKQLNLYDLAQQVVINLPPPRIQIYLQSDYEKIQQAGASSARTSPLKRGSLMGSVTFSSGGVRCAHRVQAGF
jgi:hypothetical protein